MDFVDDIRFETPANRGIAHLLDEIANLVDAIVARRVDLDDVRVRTARQLETIRAVAALMADALFAIEGFREKACHGSFSGSSRAAKKVGVRDFVVHNCVSEGADDRLLAGDFLKCLRSIFVIKSFISHSTFDYTFPPPFFLVSNLRLGRGCIG